MGATYQGDLSASGLRIAIAVSRFNENVTVRLLASARTALKRLEVADSDIDVAWVPGGFELPYAARKLAESGRYDAVICLGAIIRGETAHFDFISAEVARGIGEAARETGVPVIFGVITPDNLEQALDRAGGKTADKGYEAAVGAVEMANLARQLRAD